MHENFDRGMQLPDPPTAARRITMGSKHHFTGALVFGEGAGKTMEIESHTEMQIALVMLARPDVVDLENQLPFRWTDCHGVLHTHYFDFRLTLRDGSQVALIVKSAHKAKQPEFRYTARQIASQVPQRFADRVCVMTEKHLDPIEVHNAELIHAVRVPDPEADAAIRGAINGITGTVRIGDLAEQVGLRGRGFRAVVRQIRSHHLVLAAHERIAPDAFVRRRAA